jgi:hypothetical protein
VKNISFILLAVLLSSSVYANQCDSCEKNVGYLTEHIREINKKYNRPLVSHSAEVERMFEQWQFENPQCIDFGVRKTCFSTCFEVVSQPKDRSAGIRNCNNACGI